MPINETHDPGLECWVESANNPEGDFPIQNLPFAVFRRQGTQERWRGGVAIGDQVLDLAALAGLGILEGLASQGASAAARNKLNKLLAMGPSVWSALRVSLSRLLRRDGCHRKRVSDCLIPMKKVEYRVPTRIGDYTDFYTSIYHATNVGKLFRPDNPLLPNYQWIPIGYHGRASSIEVSGGTLIRPRGQLKFPQADTPELLPCRRLDYELELGIYIGPGNRLGESIPITQAEDHVFGLCLFNDWSARDIQAWEYQPLGPFLAKSFASTISPWIVTLEALEPFRSAWSRPDDHAQPLAYLDSPDNRARGAIDIQLDVALLTEKMLGSKSPASRLSSSSFRHSYWTVAQMVAHHTINGCNLNPGDFFGSGTQSGPEPGEQGSILELSNGGSQPIVLANGENRTFLEDGDCVIMRGYCQADGTARIGFGEVSTTVLPAS